MAEKKVETPEALRFNFEVYQLDPDPATGKRPWSFRVNGKESHYTSSNEHGVLRTIKAIQFGRPAGAVRLKAVPATASEQERSRAVANVSAWLAREFPQLDREKLHRAAENFVSPPQESGPSWADLPTLAGRVEAFLTRGKLGRKE
jgi:hypothetical protein